MTDRSAQLARLAEVLDTDVEDLEHLAPLDGAGLDQLHALVTSSLAAEDARVQEALAATMRFLPRPLRGRAGKMLFPEGHSDPGCGRRMSELLRDVELVKLAHDLQVDRSEVEFLRALSEEQLRTLRGSVNHALFAPYEPRFARMAAMSRHVPNALAAKGAQAALGPLVCARVAAAIDTTRAVELTGHLRTRFLADMTPHIDPSKVADIVARLPEDLVVEVGHEMVRRQEYIPLGRFVSYVRVETALRVIAEAPPEDLLRTAVYAEDRGALDTMIAAVEERTLAEVLQAAAASGDIDDALTLMSALAIESRTRVVGIVAALDEAVREELIRAVSRNDAWDDLAPVLDDLRDEEVLSLLDVPAVDDPEVRAGLKGAVSTTRAEQLFAQLEERRG